MLYTIPAYRLDTITKVIKRAQNKGGNISITVVREVEKEFDVQLQDGALTQVLVKCYEVKIDGEYKINGWKFIATLEHKDEGNIIRAISYEPKVPQRYYNCPATCEHCGTLRNRKDTYIVYNEKTGEFKQVGKTCLLDYTKGLTPATCEALANVFNFCAGCESMDEDTLVKGLETSSDFGFDSAKVKKVAYNVVFKYGYEKSVEGINPTAKRISNIIAGGDSIEEVATDEKIAQIDDWARGLDVSDNSYLRNARIAWLSSRASYRDFALIGSFISYYFKSIVMASKESSNREKTQYVGNIGDKISFEVDTYRVLYTKRVQVSYYNTVVSYVYEIIDKNGNTYIWSTLSILPAFDGSKVIISGTVKEHQEYKGVKQTVITRCKVN